MWPVGYYVSFLAVSMGMSVSGVVSSRDRTIVFFSGGCAFHNGYGTHTHTIVVCMLLFVMLLSLPAQTMGSDLALANSSRYNTRLEVLGVVATREASTASSFPLGSGYFFSRVWAVDLR